MSTPSPRRSIWTWDWYLPKLTILELTSEIAYRFQFRMLEGTPNIEDCRIDIGNSSRVYNRVVQTGFSQNETGKDGYSNFSKNDNGSHGGGWGGEGWRPVVSDEWVGSTSRHLNSLFSTSISVEVTGELLLEAGLELEPHSHFSKDSTYSLINHPETHDNPDRPALYHVDTDTSSTTNKYVLARLFKLIRILILSFPDDNAITDPLGVAYLRRQNVERWSGRAIYRLWGDFWSTFGLYLLRTGGPSVPRGLVRTTQDEDSLLKGIRDDADYVRCCS
ncbi:hypothetical protein BGZ90_001103 [Linnemannia elongata]|nr:hypothetical protein BGZ90_001103 [Linnemannia elongata]